MAETTFTTGIIALVDFAKDIEKIFAKDKNMVRTTKEAARLKFLELDEIFAKQEQEIVSLKAKLEISQNTANSQEQHDNIFLRGKLKESRRLLKEAQQEVITLKENTEIKNSITQNPQATNIKEKDQQIAFLKGQMEESRQMYKDLLKDNTTYFKEALTSTKIENSKQPSYAEVISNKNKATIIITPKDKEQPINEIRNNIQQQLKGTTEIENIKKVVINKNNQLIIKTTNKDQATKLKESIHKNDQLTKILEARSPQEKKLKTIIYGIPEEATENEILKTITTALDKDSEHTKLFNPPNSPPTFIRHGAAGWPDLTLCSASLFQEQEIVSLKAQLEISKSSASTQEQSENMFLKGKLKESRRLLKEAQHEIVTLKKNTENKHNSTQNLQDTNEKEQQISFLKGQLEESRFMYNELLKENTTYFKDALTNSSNKIAKQPSYAEVIRNKNQSTIIITPKDREQPMNEIRTNIQQQLKGSIEIENI
ncbi:hypothetical protein CDAR_2501 [Caerostris darwini]|uniref:Uncharacterized protein n=1 Tax=Caerostris darwini TaxID=1538125 RepID=A0AAV4N055_9ARAC|nr:hypothetical protein CDAR_2501 [Caerostris darwini]